MALAAQHTTPPVSEPAENLEMFSKINPSKPPHITAVRLELDALFLRQSQTLAQATARYSLKTRRPPPRNFDPWLSWFRFVGEKKCLVDEYDLITGISNRLARDDPAFFQERIDLGLSKVSFACSGCPSLNNSFS
jgi:hypothetical protein